PGPDDCRRNFGARAAAGACRRRASRTVSSASRGRGRVFGGVVATARHGQEGCEKHGAEEVSLHSETLDEPRVAANCASQPEPEMRIDESPASVNGARRPTRYLSPRFSSSNAGASYRLLQSMHLPRGLESINDGEPEIESEELIERSTRGVFIAGV